MSYGKMNQPISLVSTAPIRDADGFATSGDTVVANVHAYFEPRNSTEKWVNRATFAEATALFRFRAIPGVAVTTEMLIVHRSSRYDILSVEDVRGRGMYVEVLAKGVNPSG